MKISGTGGALPKKIVTNDMLSEFLDTSDEWIRTRTGVGIIYFIRKILGLLKQFSDIWSSQRENFPPISRIMIRSFGKQGCLFQIVLIWSEELW